MNNTALAAAAALKFAGLPHVTLSTSRVYKFRAFAMFITMSRECAALLKEDDILRAGLSARCRREEDPTKDLAPCTCSAGKRIVEVGISSRDAFGPHVTDDGMVRYTFDQCHSNCSSSRDHHRSRIILAIEEIPGLPVLCTPPFVLYAREKHKPNAAVKRKATRHADSDEDYEPDTPLSSQSQLQAASILSQISPQQQQHVNAKKVSAEVDASSLCVAPDSVASQPPPPPAVIIRVFATALSSAQMARLEADFVPLLEKLPGFVDFRLQMCPGFAISFTTFRTPEEAAKSSDVITRYMADEPGFRNLYQRNLIEAGVAILIAVCTSYEIQPPK